MVAFQYEPLRRVPASIRLLAIDPASTSRRLRCTLRHHALDDDLPTFGAISYTWDCQDEPSSLEYGPTALGSISYDVGNWHDDKIIHLRTSPGHDYTRFNVSHNCWSALDQLRRLCSHRVCWIDAVCIDQSNSTERREQIPLMDRIYSNADLVFVCIDVGRSLHQLARFQPADQKLSISKRQLASDTLQAISQHGYWNRVWVVQELCLARSVVLVSDAFCLHFDIFHDLGMRFANALQGTGLLALLRYLRRFCQHRDSPVYELLSAFHMRKCKEAHDLIYGLYAMMPNDVRDSLEIDYCSTLQSLFITILPFFRSHWGDYQFWRLAVKVVARLFSAWPAVPNIQQFVAAPDIDKAVWHQRLRSDIKSARLGCDCSQPEKSSQDRGSHIRLYLGKGPWNTSPPWNVICEAIPLQALHLTGDRPRLAVSCLEDRVEWQCTRHKRDEPVSWIMDMSYLDFVGTVLCAAREESLHQVIMSQAYIFRADYSQSDDLLSNDKEWSGERPDRWATTDDELVFSAVPELEHFPTPP